MYGEAGEGGGAKVGISGNFFIFENKKVAKIKQILRPPAAVLRRRDWAVSKKFSRKCSRLNPTCSAFDKFSLSVSIRIAQRMQTGVDSLGI